MGGGLPPIKLGSANRGEFYSVISMPMGVLLAINVKIDDIYQI